MANRNRNTTAAGGSFTPAQVQEVWNKGRIVPGYDPNTYRVDACNAWMERSAHGSTSKYGWEIDHVKPVAKGGTDHISNLQPLYWENNRAKADNYPEWFCAVRA